MGIRKALERQKKELDKAELKKIFDEANDKGNTLEWIIRKHTPKNDKWGDAWSHFDEVTFMDFILAKLIRAHLAVDNLPAELTADARDSIEDGVMYALELKKRLKSKHYIKHIGGD
jgi:hypothetical protein